MKAMGRLVSAAVAASAIVIVAGAGTAAAAPDCSNSAVDTYRMEQNLHASIIYVGGASGMVKMKRSPAFRPAREPGAMANTMVWFSDVRTFTRCDPGSTAVIIAFGQII